MNNLETLLNAETLHEMDSKSTLSVIKVQFERFINSDLLKPLDIYSRSFSSIRNQELKMMLKKVNEKTVAIQQSKVQEFNHRYRVQEMNKPSGIIQMKRLKRRNWNTLRFMAKIQKSLPCRINSTEPNGTVQKQ
ncbi:hypothetical protein Tco_0545490 [Tanacetum coccineum]